MLDWETLLLIGSAVITIAGTALYMRMRSNPGRTIKGDDVFQDVWVTEADIANGAIVEIDDPNDRKTTLKVPIPHDASHGWALRLAGKGLKGKGDLFVRLKVRSPYRRV